MSSPKALQRFVSVPPQTNGNSRRWIVGSKFTFFASSAPEWQQARDNDAVGIFYDNITKRFIAKYGWDWDIRLDKDCPDPTPESWEHIMDHTGLSEAEISRRNAHFMDIRKVTATHKRHVHN